MNVNDSELGKKSAYKTTYDKSLLFPISRQEKREEIGVGRDLPFYGYDIWNAYEVSWLDHNGKPEVRIVEMMYSCDSEYIIESKSLKLYFNSFNNTVFASDEDVSFLIKEDLEGVLNTEVTITLRSLQENYNIERLDGENIDNLSIKCSFDEIYKKRAADY